jgi:2-hydroxy-3-keto-5-methylthiopentenyl-1-phosphate phosphatase
LASGVAVGQSVRVKTPRLAVRSAVIDFDGTICDHDVSEEILRAFAPAGWWDIDLEFQQGLIGSRECLVRQAAMLKGSLADMLEFALRNYGLDPTFAPFVEWAGDNGVQVSVASDGFGFYLEPMLRAGGVEGVGILGNRLDIRNGATHLSFPHGHPQCVGCGTCKMRAVQSHREGRGPVAFVGEGHSDRYGALYADVVFAKKHLVDICVSDGVTYLPWQTFDDVREGLIELTAVPGPVEPDRCPGWMVSG